MGNNKFTDRELFLANRADTGIRIYSKLDGNAIRLEIVFPNEPDPIPVSWETWVHMLDMARTPQPVRKSLWNRFTDFWR